MKKLTFLTLIIFYTSLGYTQKLDSEFTFIYWMPYDNNLSSWADTIYHMIQHGISHEGIVVTVQRDLANEVGMTRSIIRKDGISHSKIQEDRSSNGLAFYDYLKWVHQKINSDKYAIIFLDHGGKLDEIGLDQYPSEGFLRVDSAAWAINQFNKLNNNIAELIFLQVCTKGSIEPVYEFKEDSKYTMFSQTVLGAPNFYYRGFFEEISRSDLYTLTGLQLSQIIVGHERIDMYQSLVTINNEAFPKLERELKAFIRQRERATAYEILNNRVLFYDGQTYFDLKAFIECFQGVESTDLLKAIDELVVMNKINPSDQTMSKHSGISLMAMQKDYLQKLEKYGHLRFFQEFPMAELYHTSTHLLGK